MQLRWRFFKLCFKLWELPPFVGLFFLLLPSEVSILRKMWSSPATAHKQAASAVSAYISPLPPLFPWFTQRICVISNFEFNIQLIPDQIFWNFDTSDATGGEIGSESATSQPMRINFSQSATSQNPNEQPDKPEYPSLALSIQRYDSKMRLLSAHYNMSLLRQCL